MKGLSRRSADLIARAVASGRRGYGKKVDEIADFVAGLMKNRLKAIGARGAKRARRIRRDPLGDPQLLEAILRRTEKLLASMAFTESRSGSAQPS